MVEVLSDATQRTERDVIADVKAVMDGIDGDGAGLVMTISPLDFGLLRGFVGRKQVTQHEAWMLKCRRLDLKIVPGYTGPPRITAIKRDSVSALEVQAKVDDVLKAHFWNARDAALRRGINGTAIS